MRSLLLLALLAVATPAFAQNSTTITTDKLAWTASIDHNATFGTPAQPLLTTYNIEFWPKASVTVAGGVYTTTGAAALVVDAGKGTPNASNELISAAIRTMLTPSTAEYYAFVTAVGPGGSNRMAVPAGPFVTPPSPRVAAAAVHLVP